MRKPMALRVDPVLLREVRKRAKAEKRTLNDYVETVLRRDLARKPRKTKRPMVELRGPVPEDVRDWKSARIPGEPARKRKARAKLVQAILDLGSVRQPYRTPSTDLGPSLIGSLDNIGQVLAIAESDSEHR